MKTRYTVYDADTFEPMGFITRNESEKTWGAKLPDMECGIVFFTWDGALDYIVRKTGVKDLRWESAA